MQLSRPRRFFAVFTGSLRPGDGKRPARHRPQVPQDFIPAARFRVVQLGGTMHHVFAIAAMESWPG